MASRAALLIGLWVAAGAWAGPPYTAPGAGVVTWTLDNLTTVGGHRVAVVGAPRVVQTDAGPAVEFNGRTDGLVLDVNPLAGLARFTLEVLFDPAAGGPDEQRFLHVEETGTGRRRALLETRVLGDGRWCLDTFLRDGEAALTLIDRNAAHPFGRWHVVALTYDGRTMTHYVDGLREASGTVSFAPMGAGRTSIGVRQNRVSWFKGRIRTVGITDEALSPCRLLAPTRGRPQATNLEATNPLRTFRPGHRVACPVPGRLSGEVVIPHCRRTRLSNRPDRSRASRTTAQPAVSCSVPSPRYHHLASDDRTQPSTGPEGVEVVANWFVHLYTLLAMWSYHSSGTSSAAPSGAWGRSRAALYGTPPPRTPAC